MILSQGHHEIIIKFYVEIPAWGTCVIFVGMWSMVLRVVHNPAWFQLSDGIVHYIYSCTGASLAKHIHFSYVPPIAHVGKIPARLYWCLVITSALGPD